MLTVKNTELRRLGLALAAIVASLALPGCDGDSPTADETPIATVGTPSTATATPARTQTPGPTPLALRPMRVERSFPALSFANMTGLYEAPNGRLFVLEQAGRILAFENRQDVTQAQVWLDIRDRVTSQGNEEGLLGLAFATDYARTGVFYLNYTAPGPRRTVVARYTAPNPGSGPADPNSEVIIVEVPQPFTNHNGGQIAFGPDGYLYIGMGDGGSARDPQGHGQNLGTLLGALLRIDVSGAEAGRNYRIPPDNPFVGSQGARPEIWAYGLRNPWRFSFDPDTGVLWLADVGQNAREEVNVIQRGGNYGWAIMEGSICLPPAQTCDMTGLIPPVHEFPTGADCSITGGYLYRGDVYPSLRGAYVFGDFCSGRVWALRYDGQRVTEHALIVETGAQITSFALDSRGNLYILDRRGRILRIANP